MLAFVWLNLRLDIFLFALDLIDQLFLEWKTSSLDQHLLKEFIIDIVVFDVLLVNRVKSPFFLNFNHLFLFRRHLRQFYSLKYLIYIVF